MKSAGTLGKDLCFSTLCRAVISRVLNLQALNFASTVGTLRCRLRWL
jgi:hypothetical protein